ncbi:triose-phosphate isomerase [Buchnera aphidicola (Pemphigus obesinymphae)]|uniref:triose-phosphate isomerase n=1 Tax=Buchnera aphidicola TaxID=9 RepID=UPI002237003B|nr:triose-phosphate isomerase [Buchnera aphidicola]MCW5196786.1 triose-phosphate isomerase [Buchnera aphidicola (Pemphigus obesinymphae)]
MKKKLIIANWKLNGNKVSILNFLNLLNKHDIEEKCKIIMSFPVIYLYLAKTIIYKKNIFLGAQNIDVNLSGPFTGEISVNMLKDIGIDYVILGHSERRKYHKESDTLIAKKFELVKKANLIPILCVGENKEEKKLGQTQEVCARQLNSVISICGPQIFNDTIIAYEPIWAIGSGETATPSSVQKIHRFIKEYIKKYGFVNSDKISVQYGGSVDENNVAQLLYEADIDGVLVGGASLNYNKFKKIIDIVNAF